MAFSEELPSPQRDFDRTLEIRAQKHEHLWARKNVTLCRSPRREFDLKLIQNNLKDKRYVEFQRRRPGSPEWSSLKSTKLHLRRMNSSEAAVMKNQSLPSKTNTLNTKMQDGSSAPELLETNALPNSREGDTQSPSKSASLWLEEKTLMRSGKGHGKKPAPAFSELIQESNKQSQPVISGSNTKATQTTFIETENNHMTSKQTPLIIHEMFLGRAAEQTDSDSVTVKETDIQRLADYLQEALWREERAKKKLAALQNSIAGLYGSLDVVWTSRCREDLLKSKIKTLEAQLHHACMQSVPEDGAKKLLVEIEKERLVYEEKTIVFLQKALLDKSEALSKAETLQEELFTAKEETLRWNNMYTELNMETTDIKQSLRLSMEHLQQLHRQLELSRATENDRKEEVSALRQENQDLQYNILLMEENCQALRDEIQQLRDDKDGGQDFVMQELLLSNKAELELTERRDSELEEKLRHTEEKLQLKERECEELQTEMKTMEHECQSSQARLTQCREELRLLSQRHRKQTPCVSWWRVCVLLLFVAVCGVAMLWMCHPPFRELVEDLYSDLETHIEGCLLQMVSPQRPGCFRPI
ncbi:TRAF3-interacting JNK-activating modulator isoform X2 [Gouania willdenowi]|uniref:TRAF3-interacting JNK-activating modulator isoform X2 n=1 Tax=Gouania willdenowi TaxID=441366 RepID=UPI001054963A|nr:TRAF3-interacting JNK-activating modulator-like isoform X2 [Gouania willdenowi]